MALISCPECGSRISDVAITCPHCGFTVSGSQGIIPLGSLPQADRKPQIQIPGTSIFDDGTELAPSSAKDTLAALFTDAEKVAKIAPAVYDAVQKIMQKRGTIWAADFSEAATKLMEKGELTLSIEKKTKKLLPQLRSVETGQIYEKARLKAVDVPDGVAASFATVQLQATMAELMREIKSLAVNVESLRLEAQADRIARAEAVWQRLQQATHIQDPRLREAKILAIADSATEARCILQKNYDTQRRLATSGKGKNSDRGSAAAAAITNLTVIALMARTEYASYALIGEDESAKVAFEQFKSFVCDSRLCNRQVLLELNSCSNVDLTPTINKMNSLAVHVESLELPASSKPHALPSPDSAETGDDDE